MKALIGITTTQSVGERKVELWQEYAEAVAAAGGVPIILPSLDLFPFYKEYLTEIDGVLISGGQDLMPLTYGEEQIEGFHLISDMTPERDNFEITLIKKAMEINMPILGICRGIQAITVANGGTLYQDIDTCITRTNRIKHFQECPYWVETHVVEIQKNTILFDIFHKDQLMTNSIHHQSVKQLPEGFIVTARAKDGVIEAIESLRHNFVLGVQWHPERLFKKNKEWVKLFETFLNKAEEYHRRRE